MAMDFNKVADALKRQQSLGVNRDGQIIPVNPQNDGTRDRSNGNTTLEPKRFFK